MICSALNQHSELNRKDIDELLTNKLPDWMTRQQKKNKVTNLLTSCKKQGKIENLGADSRPKWVLLKK